MYHAPERVVSVGAGTAVRLLMLIMLALAAAPCAVRRVLATTIYVRESGNDNNQGDRPAAAMRTIRHAASLAKAGDRIVVGPGTYAEGNITLPPAAYARVVFVADRRGIEVGEPPGDVVIDATTFTSGFELNHNLMTTIDGFVIYGGGNGIYVKSQSDQTVVSNNIICSNTDNGVYVQDSKSVVIFNNLIYNNEKGAGILVAGNVSGSPGARIINNTVYQNGSRGIFVAGTTIGSPGAIVFNNVLQGNTSAGIQINAVSRDGYLSAGNVSDDRFASGTPVDVTDIRDDPEFVNPAGPDQMLGGRDYADDDFHLQQTAAGQAVTSPAVDAGSELARRFGLSRSSTRTDGRPDGGWIDAGFHYDNFGPPPNRPEARVRYAPLYVNAASGRDENDGARAASALLTIGRALNVAQPGNRILLLGGDYREGQLRPPNSGKPGREIIIEGMSGAVINASGSDRGFLISGRSYITLVGLEVIGATDSGIEIRSGSKNVSVRRCHLYLNGRRGLYVNGASAISVQATILENNGSRGMQVDSGQVDVTRSSFNANVEHGLFATSNSTVAISGCQLDENRQSGVLADKSTVTIEDTEIIDNRESGARFTNGSTGRLTRVSVLNNRDGGIQGISSLVNVSGGEVDGNGRLGVEVFADVGGGASQLAMTGTHICNSQGPGVRAQVADVTLTDMTLCNNAEEGLRQSGGTTRILRSTVTQNYGKGVSVDGADQFVVQDTQVSNNGDNGLQVAAAKAGSISMVTAQANKGHGLWLLNGSNLSLSGVQSLNNTGAGVVVDQSTALLTNGTISGNGQEGWRQSGGTLQITGTMIAQNQSKGLSVNGADQFVLQNAQVGSNAGKGVQVLSAKAASINGSVVYKNTDTGITILDSTGVQLWNNLVYGNGSTGILVSGDATGSLNAQVLNNTIVANANRGLLIGGDNSKPPSAGAVVLRNILQDNVPAGVQVNQLSLPGYVGDYNLSVDPYGSLTPIGTHDVLSSPQFIDPGKDFHLNRASPAIDAGGIDVDAAGMQGLVTRGDGVPDTGIVDLGYHYQP